MPPSDKGKEPKIRKKPGRRQTSCAECRRLKLKCDRGVPCEKCVSRGCGEICPEGVLASTKGNRMVLAGTEELHERIDFLGARIRELEDALKILQEQVSDQPHPLLRTDVLRPPPPPVPSQSSSTVPIRPPLSRRQSYQGSTSNSTTSGTTSASSSAKSPPPSHSGDSEMKSAEEEDADVQVIDAFGTLTVCQNGVSRYIGKTARSEFLIRAPIKQNPNPPHYASHFPDEMMHSPFPDFEPRGSIPKETVYRSLPPMSQATQLCDRYLSHSKYLYAAIPRTELYDDILAAVYQAHSYESFQVHHSMALLFIIFALALHFDSQGGDAEYYRQREAAGYYQLARTTLGFASPVRETTVASIQTLIHMAQYLDLCDWESSGSASSWLYVGQAVRLGLSMGLNLNPARWRLPESDTNKRKRVFWQLFVSDTWTSFYFGRPPSISPNYIDCPVPDGIELAKQAAASSTAASTSTTGFEHSTGSHTDFQTWIYRFTTLMHFVMSSGMGPKQPASYSAILDLDRQIRDFPVPAVWRTAVVGSPDEREQQAITTETYFHRWAVLASQETILLNLHRAYFAQALYENSHDLQEHRYIPSVVAIYRSSWRIVTGLQLTWERASDVIQRVNLPWSQALSAAIVMCLLITRAPSSHLVTPALDKLGQLVGLFHAASPSCRFAENLLPTIQRLHNKACESVNPPLPRYQPTAPAYESSITQAELDRLSGRTYLFSEADSSAHIGSSSPTTSSPHLTSSPSSSISCGPAQMQRGEDKPRRPSSRSSGKSSTTAASTGTPSSSLNLDSLHQVLVEDLKDYGRRATVPTVQTLNDGVVGSGSRGTSPQSTPTDAGVRNGSPGGSRSSDYMSSRGSGHHAGHPPSSAPPSMSTTSSTSMDPIVGHHLPPSHHGHHLVPASQYQQQQQQQQQPPYYSSGGHVSATGHMPLAPPPPPPIHHPPPAYLPPSGGHQGVPHHSMTRPPSMDTVPPFPGTDPTYGVYNSNGVTPPANGDRKYATLTNCMPGFNPTIEGLDASWQSLVEQLGY